jgi:hypothetical protein
VQRLVEHDTPPAFGVVGIASDAGHVLAGVDQHGLQQRAARHERVVGIARAARVEAVDEVLPNQAAAAVALGHAMLVPVEARVPQATELLADWIEQPGVNRSGLRRPSAVGPTPPPHLLTALAPFCALPTATRFLAFSGLRSVAWLVSAKNTRLSSFCH